MRPTKLGKRVKCCWKYCPYEQEDHWVSRDEAKRDGTLYFHADCFQHRNNLRSIIKIWRRYIWSKAEKSDIEEKYLVATRKRGMDGDLLLFGTKYWAKKKAPLNAPFNMYLMDRSQDLMDAWEEYKKTGKILGEDDEY